MDACGNGGAMVITVQNNTVVSSPNFPEDYPNNMNCTWHIVADRNNLIELSLKGHDLEKEYDLFLVTILLHFKYMVNISVSCVLIHVVSVIFV